MLSLLVVESSAIVFSAGTTAAGLLLFVCCYEQCAIDTVSVSVLCTSAASVCEQQHVILALCATITNAAGLSDSKRVAIYVYCMQCLRKANRRTTLTSVLLVAAAVELVAAVRARSASAAG